uniref:Uncharacterized protein n=1 Tax=Rhinopithecus roxellana TaxID=61622 RepID=A0A2K6QDC3_RHIRO
MRKKSAFYLHLIPVCLPLPNPLAFRFAWNCRRNPSKPLRKYQCLGDERFSSTRHNFTQRKTEHLI